ncbi:MAG: DUF3365 domain-containing protein [Sphingomonadales bacterium]|nr:DUF3365 domain-containing protein [Sphingomonadales bacterium]NCQ19794.1 DUF3365 domain-containing protein [Sphingomonadales bacterium]NCT05053.1 DUF3365 domain-containing protein [Sphingomonadales bacterium]
MKRIVMATGLGLLATGCASEQARSPDPAFVQSATQLADTYQANLQAELSAAMKQVGPVGAISVCQSVAPALAADLSSNGDLAVSRVARRNRNPDNAVPAELDALYQQLEREPLRDGKPHVVAATIGQREVFMRALPMKDQPCSQCHGTNIAPDVKAAIDASYPDDRATGFAAGDLRGAMLVMRAAP